MHCPKCGRSLREQQRSGIPTDVCSGCKGVWLDRGELEKIIQRERRYLDEDEDDDGGGHDDEFEFEGARRGRGDKGRRRGGFFENLMDMFSGE